MLSALVALLAAPLLLAPRPAAPEDAVTAAGIAHELDLSARWLRGAQDPETGAWGDGTARELGQALLALARHPRGYRRADGPFMARPLELLAKLQREDGAFPDAHLQRSAIDSNTALVAAALAALGETGPGTTHAKAVAYLGDRGQGLAGYYAPHAFASPEQAADQARGLLAARSADGSWPDALFGGPSLLRTAQSMIGLCDAWLGLKAAEGASDGSARETKPLPAFSAAERGRVKVALERGAEFLAGEAQAGRFGASGRPDAGITAMVLSALMAAGERVELPAAARAAADQGLDWLRSLQKEDGSIHEGQVANYVTSAAVMALAKSGRPEDGEVIARARAFLQRLQADEGEGYDPSHHYYGGVGYGDDERPDLSNTQMALEALAAAGLAKGDPTFQRALRFLERAQNRSESNDIALVKDDGGTVKSGNDGGGVYAPGDSKAGYVELSDGTRVPRSYGSMTYALLKSYLFAGLPKDDPRVKAAWEWLREHYTLDVNPGFEASADPRASYQGLFYYFYTMAHALDLYGEERVKDAAGAEHAWRGELAGRLVAMQRQDGSWINENSPRWWEGNPVLATAYALLALSKTLAGPAGAGPQ